LGEMARCQSGRRRGLCRTLDLLSQDVFTTVTKDPLVSGHIMTRDWSPPFCHGWPNNPWQKWHFTRDPLKANFRPLVPGGDTTREKRGSFCLGWYTTQD
jgi:hypothetical protein